MYHSAHHTTPFPVLCTEYVSVCDGRTIFCRLLSRKRVISIIGARRRVINGEYIYIRLRHRRQRGIGE